MDHYNNCFEHHKSKIKKFVIFCGIVSIDVFKEFVAVRDGLRLSLVSLSLYRFADTANPCAGEPQVDLRGAGTSQRIHSTRDQVYNNQLWLSDNFKFCAPKDHYKLLHEDTMLEDTLCYSKRFDAIRKSCDIDYFSIPLQGEKGLAKLSEKALTMNML